MTGPRKLNSLEALAAYKERKRRDAQAPVGATEFDDSGDEDQDLGGFGSGRTIDGMGDGSRDDTTVPMYDAMYPPDENEDDSPVPGAAIAHRAMIVGQNRERALANARVEAQRAADEALVARFRDVTLPQILARNPERRDQLAAIFANLMRDEDMSGEGFSGGAHDAERLALRVAKNNLAHRRRILTRFDNFEDDTWLDPDRSGPPNSNLNQAYDDTDEVDDAEEDLRAARAEHAELGDNALDGSQLAEMLAGEGSALTITAY